MRIFLDTNVLASAIATRGLCSELFESVIHDHELLTCEPVLVELERVLMGKLNLPAPVINGFLDLVKAESELIRSHKKPSARIKDADDIPIIACAIAGKADAFVTGDKALLDHRQIDELRIISPRQMWLHLAGLKE